MHGTGGSKKKKKNVKSDRKKTGRESEVKKKGTFLFYLLFCLGKLRRKQYWIFEGTVKLGVLDQLTLSNCEKMCAEQGRTDTESGGPLQKFCRKYSIVLGVFL